VTNPAPMTPPPQEPPSAKPLLRSTAIAAAVALLIVVTIVLPAEYGKDPTGIGQLLGLKEMGEIKMRLAQEEAGHDADGEATPQTPSPAANTAGVTQSPALERSDVTEVVLAPTQAKELKLAMSKDARVAYAWATNRGVVNYDMHADNPSTKYHGYTKGQGVRADSGSLVAAFDGMHGWFWRNRGRDSVTVTLRTKGAYTELKWIQ
jgi:hypothetical protein